MPLGCALLVVDLQVSCDVCVGVLGQPDQEQGLGQLYELRLPAYQSCRSDALVS
jgi:hypothetical protein